MPRAAEWLGNISAAIEKLEALTVPVIDRAMLERLLGIHRRAAIRLMHRWGGYQAGRTFLVERAQLLRELEAIAAGDAFEREIGRRERISAALGSAAHEARVRSIKITLPAAARSREVAGLPPTIHLAPGRLEISCTSAQDLLKQLAELAQAVTNDYEGFEARLRGRVG